MRNTEESTLKQNNMPRGKVPVKSPERIRFETEMNNRVAMGKHSTWIFDDVWELYSDPYYNVFKEEATEPNEYNQVEIYAVFVPDMVMPIRCDSRQEVIDVIKARIDPKDQNNDDIDFQDIIQKLWLIRQNKIYKFFDIEVIFFTEKYGYRKGSIYKN